VAANASTATDAITFYASALAPVFIGGSLLTILKSMYRPEDDIKKDVDRLRQVLLERVCQSYDRLIPVLPDVYNTFNTFSSTAGAKQSLEDIRTMLRGDGKGKPDLCYEHFKVLFATSRHLAVLDVILFRYRTFDCTIFVLAVVGFLFGLAGMIYKQLQPLAPIVGGVMCVVQCASVYAMRRLNGSLEQVERS
jgi:hypothetical protein